MDTPQVTVDWRSVYHTLTKQWSMLTLERVVKFVDQTSFLEERMPNLGLFLISPKGPIKDAVSPLEGLIGQYYMDMNIADKLPNVGYVRDVLTSKRFNVPDPYALALAHLVVVSSIVTPTQKTTSDATFLCAKIMRDDFSLFAYKILVAHMITAAFPAPLVEYLGAYIAALEGMGGVLPPSW
jgi:hypothetical protein